PSAPSPAELLPSTSAWGSATNFKDSPRDRLLGASCSSRQSPAKVLAGTASRRQRWMPSERRDFLKIKGLAFDAYGTLYDVHSVIDLGEQLFPGQGTVLSNAWRLKQLQYTWQRSLMDRYADFWKVTEDGLVFAANSLNLKLESSKRKQLMDAYLSLK